MSLNSACSMRPTAGEFIGLWTDGSDLCRQWRAIMTQPS
jgi:hypothetical protein